MPSPTRIGGRTYTSNMVDHHLKLSNAQDVNLTQPQLGRPILGPSYGFKVYEAGSVIRYGWDHFFVDEWWHRGRKVATLSSTGDGFLELILLQRDHDSSGIHSETQFINKMLGHLYKMMSIHGERNFLNLYRWAGPREKDLRRAKAQMRLHGGTTGRVIWGVRLIGCYPAASTIPPRVENRSCGFFAKSLYGKTIFSASTARFDLNSYSASQTCYRALKSVKFKSHLRVLFRIEIDREFPQSARRSMIMGIEADDKPVVMKAELPRTITYLTLSDLPVGLPASDLSSRFYEKVAPALLLPSRHSPAGEAHKALLQREGLAGRRYRLAPFEGSTYGLEKYQALEKAHFDIPED